MRLHRALPALAVVAASGAWAGSIDGYPPEQPYSVAMHMHASMSEQFGSMEWHAEKAQSVGHDVVWWTDHDWRLTNFRFMKRYNFEATVWNSLKTRWEEPDEGGFAPRLRAWAYRLPRSGIVTTALADTAAFAGTKCFQLSTHGEAGNPQFVSEYLDQWAEELNNKYSLAKRLKIRFAVKPELLDPLDTRFVVQAEFSDHPGSTPVLRYVLGSMDGEGVHSIQLSYTPGVWNEYEIDLTAAVRAHFTSGGADTLRGLDNTLGTLSIGLETRDGAPATVFFDDYRLIPNPAFVGDVMMDEARAISTYYEQLWPGPSYFVGTEISKFKAQPHLNGFAPDVTLVDYTGYDWPDSLTYAIEQMHAQGGAVSLNHFFGPQPLQQAEPDSVHQARIRFTKTVLIEARAMGVDILEAGYRWRGGMNLWEHVDLWDALNANQVFLTGNGITDSHGRGWDYLIGWVESLPGDTTTNNFTSWILTEEFSEAGFVQGMKRGRLYFGDPYRWNASLDLRTLDGFRMGQVVTTDRSQHDVTVEVTGLGPDGKVRLLQFEMREPEPPELPQYIDPVVLRDEYLPGTLSSGTFTDTVSVDTQLPSFVRIEAWDDRGELVFSNPIYFVHAVPEAGVAAERVAARLGDVRLFLAEEFRLTDVSFDADTAVLSITGDETIPGAGELSIDPGPLGGPSSVLGASGWTYVSGVLTLSGFEGAGSSIQVTWGPTGVSTELPAGRELSLAPGRPNPFGDGTLVEFVLPKAGWTRLEVLDVAGRRVRTLVAEGREAGLFRERWDGRDEGGRQVADGVYWLRLTHDGETLTRKAVRVH
jgi:hypothetical protein